MAKEEVRDKGVTRIPAGEGLSLWVLGELVTYKTTSEQTGGAYSLFEVTTQPEVGPPPHVQHREDEAFYVLEGEYEFLVEGRTIDADAGSLIYVPRGNLHAHKNVGKEPGRMLVSQTPGGTHERFFDEIGEEQRYASAPTVSEDPPGLESVTKIAAGYGIEMSPPVARTTGGQRSRNEQVRVPDHERERFAQ